MSPVKLEKTMGLSSCACLSLTNKFRQRSLGTLAKGEEKKSLGRKEARGGSEDDVVHDRAGAYHCFFHGRDLSCAAAGGLAGWTVGALLHRVLHNCTGLVFDFETGGGSYNIAIPTGKIDEKGWIFRSDKKTHQFGPVREPHRQWQSVNCKEQQCLGMPWLITDQKVPSGQALHEQH